MDEIIIDSVDEPTQRLGKEKIFRDILLRHDLVAHEVAVIGDSPHSELRAGKNLGCITIQTLRPNVTREEGFNHYITSLHELSAILGK